MHVETLFITTVAMPWGVRAGLDVLKAKRAEHTGKRPTTKELVVEALEAFLKHQRVVAAAT